MKLFARGALEWPTIYGMVQAAVKHIDAGRNTDALGVYAAEYLRLKGLYIQSIPHVAPASQVASRLAEVKLRALTAIRAVAHPNVLTLCNAVDDGHALVAGIPASGLERL